MGRGLGGRIATVEKDRGGGGGEMLKRGDRSL